MIKSGCDDSRTLQPCRIVSNCIDEGLNSSIPDPSESESESESELSCEETEELNRCKQDGSTNIQQTKWQAMYEQLIEFREKYGHCLVPNRYRENQALGAWVSTQRRQYKILVSGSCASTPMTPERASMLEAIGFVWATTDPRHVPWELRFRELCVFKKKYGTCLVPMGYKKNVKLANWVSTQRQEFKLLREGKTSRLTTERVKLLDSIGFIWEAHRGGLRIKKLKPPDLIENPVEISDPRTNFPENRLEILGQFQSSAIGSVINKRELGFESILSSRLIGPRIQSLMQCPGYFFSPRNQSESTLSGFHPMGFNSNIQGTYLRQDDVRNLNSWNSREDGNIPNCFDFPMRNISSLLSGRLNSRETILPYTLLKMQNAKKGSIVDGFQEQNLKRKLEESTQHHTFPHFNAPVDMMESECLNESYVHQDSENESHKVKRHKTQIIRRNEEFESIKVNGDSQFLRVPFTSDSIQQRNSCSNRFFSTEINLDSPGCIINVENSQIPVPLNTPSISFLQSTSLQADDMDTKTLNNSCGPSEAMSLQRDEMDTKPPKNNFGPSESMSLQADDDMDTKAPNNNCGPAESMSFQADDRKNKAPKNNCGSSQSMSSQRDDRKNKAPNEKVGASDASKPFPNPDFGIFDDAEEGEVES